MMQKLDPSVDPQRFSNNSILVDQDSIIHTAILVGFLHASNRYDTWCKYFASNRFLKNTSEYVSFLRFLAYPASTLTIHPRYKPYDYRTTTYTAVIQQYTKYTTVTIM